MTTTILRHELYRTVRPLLAIVGIAVLVIALADFAGMFIGVIGLVLAAMVAAMMLPAVQLFHAIDFYQSSYGSGAMLTHLLPISGRKFFWTKLLYAVLITILTGIVSLAIILLQLRLGMAAVDLNLTEAYTELQQIFTSPEIWAAIAFFDLWVLLVPLVSMYASVGSYPNVSLYRTPTDLDHTVDLGRDRFLCFVGATGTACIDVSMRCYR